MITKNFGLFNFIEVVSWYEIFDFQKPIDYALFLYFIKNYEVYFDQVDLNTIHNTYSNKKFYFKVGIDLTGYQNDFCCGINFWIGDNYFTSAYRVPYSLYGYNNIVITNGTIPNRIKNYYFLNSNTIFYYTKN